MNVELSESQARFLEKHIERRIDELEKEAARTDRHDLQHALATDVERLKEILGRVEAALRPEAVIRA
jgi:chromosomal replication initiation ATPase DnaA